MDEEQGNFFTHGVIATAMVFLPWCDFHFATEATFVSERQFLDISRVDLNCFLSFCGLSDSDVAEDLNIQSDLYALADRAFSWQFMLTGCQI